MDPYDESLKNVSKSKFVAAVVDMNDKIKQWIVEEHLIYSINLIIMFVFENSVIQCRW